MKVTDELLMVARAVRENFKREWNLGIYSTFDECLAAVIAALPEAAPLPAPTGQGWWRVRPKIGHRFVWRPDGGEWEYVWFDGHNGEVYRAGWAAPAWVGDFDAWVGPLAEPATDSKS